MNFIDLDIEFIIQQLERLNQETQPKWGKMSAQRMIEHLSDSVRISTGKSSFPLEIPEDRIGRMQDFLRSDKPMMKNVEVPFATENTPLRHEEMALAIDELVLELIDFEDYYGEDEKKTALHPYYGHLNYDLWILLHKKHFSHHFAQFGLIED